MSDEMSLQPVINSLKIAIAANQAALHDSATPVENIPAIVARTAFQMNNVATLGGGTQPPADWLPPNERT